MRHHSQRTAKPRMHRGRRLSAGVGAVLAVSLGAAGLPSLATGAPESEPDSRVIVVMDGEPALAATEAGTLAPGEVAAETAEHRAELRAAHDVFRTAAEDAGVRLTQRHEFTDLVDGVAVTVAASDVDRLYELPGVVDVVPDQRIRSATDVSVPLVGAPEVWKRDDANGTPVRGAGTTVAVLDSGIDYTNPSLGGAFGPEHKVVAGHDYVDDDADPMDDNGHGTHVAGIIAGDGDVTGVAPDASLTAYRVIGSDGFGWEADIIAGLEAAIAPENPHRADVVNMSLGGPGDGTDPLGQAATAATEAGVVVVSSAGNSGPGAQTVTSPALADGVLAVGASTSGISQPAARMVEPRTEPVQTFRAPYSASPPGEPVSGELVDVGDGTDEDYDRVGDVEGKVVAYRAEIAGDGASVTPAMIEQAKRAEDRGAIALIAYTGASSEAGHGEGPFTAGEPGTVEVPLPGAESGDDFRMDRIVVMGLLQTQWEQLRRDLADGPVRVEISGEDVTDQVASFSSRGPTAQFGLEPDLVAPGVEIRSTWPLEQWDPGVYRLSGTSMAGPHVAAAAALLRQLNPDESVDHVGARLVGSATPVDGADPTTAGSGRLDVGRAVSADVVAEPMSLSLGLADLSSGDVSTSATVTLRNGGGEDVPVSLRAEKAGDSIGTATVEPAEAVVPAGGEVEVEVSVAAPGPDGDVDLSGWVVAEATGPAGEGQPDVRIPYLHAVRPLVVQTSPEPSDGTSTAFVWSPVPLDGPPTVTVTAPSGDSEDVVAEHDHGDWYRAELTGDGVGVYQVEADADAAGGQHLTGAGVFEVAQPPGDSDSPARWHPVGPNGDGGEIATTPADSDVAAVAQFTKAGLWTTEDAGEQWAQRNRMPVAGGTGHVVVDADDPGTMWYAINGSTGGALNEVLDPTYTGRVLRTADAGQTWETLEFPDVHVIELVADPDTEVLAAVTEDSVQVSRDGGDTWEAHPNAGGSELTDAAVGGDDLFLAGPAGIWAMRGLMSGGDGATEQVYDAGRVDAMVADDTIVAALTGDDVVVGSRDGGGQWAELFEAPDGGALDLSMAGSDIVVSTYREHQYIGRDHGTSWSRVPQPVDGPIENDVAPWDGGLLWSSPGAGLFHTEHDGTNPRRTGVQGLTPHDLAVTDRDGTPTLLAGTDREVFDTELPNRPRLESDVAEWGLSGHESSSGSKVGHLAVSPQDPQVAWKVRKDALSQFQVYRSADGGNEWALRGSTTEVPYDLMVGPDDADRVVVPFWSLRGRGLYVTTDGGANWRKLFQDEMFTAVAADPADPERLWLGSSSGLYRSDDFGQSVQKVTDGEVTAIEVSGSKIVAAGDEIQVSDDGGRSFETADSGGLPMLVADVLVTENGRSSGETWYAATGSYTANGLVKGGRGVLKSSDGGHTWVNVSSGLQNLDTVSLAQSFDDRWLFVGTVDGGVHRVRVD